jgi:hypothetical protein
MVPPVICFCMETLLCSKPLFKLKKHKLGKDLESSNYLIIHAHEELFPPSAIGCNSHLVLIKRQFINGLSSNYTISMCPFSLPGNIARSDECWLICSY